MANARVPHRYRDPIRNESPQFALMRKVLRLPMPTDEQISRLRDTLYEGDPLADALVAEMAGMSRSEAHGLLARALEQGINSIASPPPALVDLFQSLDQRPKWINDELLEIAASVADRVGMSGERVLSCVCLTGGYRSSAANKPIAFTGALESMAYRRLAETSKFVFDLYDSRLVNRESAGFRGAVMVRMLHAMIRRRLDKDPRWQHDEWGSPINQADLLSTNLLFSTVFVLGLRAYGHIITKREADALVHFWRYVGYLMGIRLDLLPKDFDEACVLTYLAGTTQPAGDEDSKKLAAALLSVPMDPSFSPWRKQIDIYKRAGFSRFLLGEREGDELGLPNHPLRWLILPTIAWNFSTELAGRFIPGVGEYIKKVRRARVRTLVELSLAGEMPNYQPYAATR
jgi:hypothetical protein